MDKKSQHLIEIIIGPCTRKEADNYAIVIQETLDRNLPALEATIAVKYLDKT